ncbi:MAG: HlyD family secretion protein [Akkermansia sp.]
MSKHLKAISITGMSVVAVGGLFWGLWHIHERNSIATDDSRIEASIVSVGSKLAERIVSMDVEEGDTVTLGQTIARLDKRMIRAKQLAARSKVAIMRAHYDEMQSGFRHQEIESQRAKTAQASANLERARRDYERISKLEKDNAGISLADLDAVKASYLAAQAIQKSEEENLALKQEGYREEEKRSALAQLEEAQAELDELNVLGEECLIKSPVDGVVARKLANAGELVNVGQKLFSIVNNRDIWLNIRVEETKIGRIKPGQDVEFSLDGYHGRKFHGKVYEVGAATCATFSLLSTENVSGYFTKVMQRFPIKVSLPKDESGVVFRPGMQGTAKINS